MDAKGGSFTTPFKVKLASGAGGTFGVDDIAVAWATSGGFWKEEGLDIEWVPARGGVKVAEAVLAGEVDGGYGTWLPCVARHLEDKPLRILLSMAQSLAQNLVARKDKITSAQDLRGKRWAVDGIGALSHTLGQLIVKGLGLADGDVTWVVSGPPPQRIEALLSGDADCSLIRVEEAVALTRDHPELLHKLLPFEEILSIAPTQPHGVISATKDFVEKQPEVCAALCRGLIRASRSLHDSLDDFKEAVRQNVTERPPSVGSPVLVSDQEVEAIWRQEVAAGSFAVNGGLSEKHWAKQLGVYSELLSDARAASLSLQDFAEPAIVAQAVADLGGLHKTSGHDLLH
ncbi:unnamed protein product [Polarella glacialis]|uniref:SsuA/THI5-like domain-containing protein n=1 Tax=Polarella glacialis TaxID=89957 RepID=A0A813HJ49_POLGL|nr:unnamed protein product [Polarella glacialis]